jgi:hypothetical protein
MFTLFTTAKPFVGHFGMIQRNAIHSWVALEAHPDIILFGDSPGTAEIAREFGLIHIPDVETNEKGTPLISAMFRIAQERSRFPIMCYSNCDMILMNDFSQVVSNIATDKRCFLAVGQRTDLDVTEPIEFTGDWETSLQHFAHEKGVLHAPTGMDVFVFPRGMIEQIPDFAVGRVGWDGWMIYNALRRFIPIVNITSSVLLIHQNHDYSHLQGGREEARSGAESSRNIELVGAKAVWYTLDESTHTYQNGRIERDLWKVIRGFFKTFGVKYPRFSKRAIAMTYRLEKLWHKVFRPTRHSHSAE